MRAMRNVTVTVDDPALEWARVEAARRNTSVSRLLGDMLADRMRQQDAYAQAMRQALAFESLPMGPAPRRKPAEGASA
jgi:hypothetical protein